MEKIANFLEKMRRFSIPDETVRKTAVQAIKDVTGVEIGIGDVRMQNGILYIKGNASLKNHLYLKKQAVLDSLKVTLENKAPVDIR